jgi:hypothetical protein
MGDARYRPSQKRVCIREYHVPAHSCVIKKNLPPIIGNEKKEECRRERILAWIWADVYILLTQGI